MKVFLRSIGLGFLMLLFICLLGVISSLFCYFILPTVVLKITFIIVSLIGIFIYYSYIFYKEFKND